MNQAQLEKYKKEYNQLERDLVNPDVLSNPDALKEISQKISQLEPIVKKYDELMAIEKEIVQNQELITTETDNELVSIATEDNEFLREQKIRVLEELKKLTSPSKQGGNEVIIEIRAGTGGEEAALFAANLFKMYHQYAQKSGWYVHVLSSSPSELGGFKEVIIEIKGEDAYNKLKFESGVHRVQRIPKTEKSGRVHTSTATVAVLESGREIEDVNIEAKDIRIDIFRSGGPGGQGVNTTDSAVRITHLPTNIVVSCQDERSQLKNREKAIKVLKSRLLAKMREEQESKESTARKTQIKQAKRSEKIRTYNFPQDRITDHRMKKSWSNMDEILNGGLGKIIEAKIEE